MGDVSRHTTVTLDGRRFRWMRAVSKHTTVKLNESRFKTHNGYATVSSHTTDMLTVSSRTTDMRTVSFHNGYANRFIAQRICAPFQGTQVTQRLRRIRAVSRHTTDMRTVSSHTTDMPTVSCHTTNMRTVSKNNRNVRWETFRDTQWLRCLGDGSVG
eukprot:GHVL01002854.1.p1 GENE.GHVL01002854.1~~GHVL01002854.1.p1  ORF type:complete len:157 (-),score=15.94 GHVL01002854.1:596-1066(-)